MSCPNCDHTEMIENDTQPGVFDCADCGYHEER